MMADNAELYSEIYMETSRPFRDLNPAERVFHFALFAHMTNYNEQTYLHHLDGAIDDHIFDTSYRQMINLFRSSPLHRESWAFLAHVQQIFDERFVQYVDNEVLPGVGPIPE